MKEIWKKYKNTNLLEHIPTTSLGFKIVLISSITLILLFSFWDYVSLHHELIRNLGLVSAALIGFPMLIWRTRIADRLAATGEASHTAETYTKAIEQLGAIKTDGTPSIELRLGGLYALENIARTNEKYHPQIIEVLCAYVRMHAPRPVAPPSAREFQEMVESGEVVLTEGEKLPPLDVQTALTIIGRRNVNFDGDVSLNLASTGLGGYQLANADFANADLSGADLTKANLSGSDLSGANLIKTNLTGAYLSCSDLTWTNAFDAILFEADLSEADLSNAKLGSANLVSATLCNAKLIQTVLVGANLTQAVLINADLTQAELSDAKLTHARLTQANLSRASLSGANLARAILSRADFTDADLTDADLTKANLNNANLNNADLARANISSIMGNNIKIDRVVPVEKRAKLLSIMQQKETAKKLGSVLIDK